MMLNMDTNPEINDKAAVLGRMLTYFQVGSDNEFPAVLVQQYVALIHKVSGELLVDLEQVEPATPVRMATELTDSSAELLAELLGGQAPDTMPDDWRT